MLRVRFRLDELQCLSPVSASGDEVYVMFAGASVDGLRAVRVQPEKAIDRRYGWLMVQGRSVSPDLTIEEVHLNELAQAEFHVVLVARHASTYSDALSTASGLADYFASPAGQSPIAGLLFQLPDVLTGGDRVLGDFNISMMHMAGDWTGMYQYGAETQPQPEARRSIRSLMSALSGSAKRDAAGMQRTRYECRRNGARYLLAFSIESVVEG